MKARVRAAVKKYLLKVIWMAMVSAVMIILMIPWASAYTEEEVEGLSSAWFRWLDVGGDTWAQHYPAATDWATAYSYLIIQSDDQANKWQSVGRFMVSINATDWHDVEVTTVSLNFLSAGVGQTGFENWVPRIGICFATPDDGANIDLDDWSHFNGDLRVSNRTYDILDIEDGEWLSFPLNALGMVLFEDAAGDNTTFSVVLGYVDDLTNSAPVWEESHSAVYHGSMAEQNIAQTKWVVGSGVGFPDDDDPTGGGTIIDLDGDDALDVVLDRVGGAIGLVGWGGHWLLLMILAVIGMYCTWSSKFWRVALPVLIFGAGIIIGWVDIWFVVILALGVGIYAYKALSGRGGG